MYALFHHLEISYHRKSAKFVERCKTFQKIILLFLDDGVLKIFFLKSLLEIQWLLVTKQ